jgi:hypothetical protein
VRPNTLSVPLLASTLIGALLPVHESPSVGQEVRDIANWATVEAHDDGVPVYAFGYTYVYGVSPDFFPSVVTQEGNNAQVRKIQPRKSWEIDDNLFGSTPAREPRTAANDDQPLLAVHLIDGDVLSSWASRGQNQADADPEWIRIDLPVETLINRVVLVGHPEGMGNSQQFNPTAGSVKVGQAFPRRLEIRISRDAWHWETVFKSDTYTAGDIRGRNEIPFDPHIAKQIWILGSDLPPTHYFGHCFSISEAEVLTPQGENVALISRGAGVQVSSTHTGYGMDRFTQDMLWPTQYDLGFKWSRIGYDMSLFQWAYVERQKGKLQVDERADAAVTEAVKNGIRIVMTLDKGNWLYAATPKDRDRTRDLMETYSNNPGKVTDYAPMLAGYLNYVRFMVRHFKGRVKVFEVWNEWGPYTYDEAKKYAVLLKKAIPIIREEDPQAKIMPASPGWLVKDQFGWFRALGEEGLLSQVDVIGFHPFYNPSPSDPYLVSFPKDFPQFQRIVAGYGFRGSYMASEWDYFTAYPPSDLPGYSDRDTPSEIQKAIYSARLSITFAHFNIVNLWNETFQTQQTMRGLSLFRNTTFSNEVINPTQPEPVYYAFRTLSTVLADVRGTDLAFTFSGNRREIESYGFVRKNGEILIAFWVPGVAEEHSSYTVNADLALKGYSGEKASIIDVLDGTEQPLDVERTTDGIMIRRLRVQNWPLIIRLPH